MVLSPTDYALKMHELYGTIDIKRDERGGLKILQKRWGC